MTEPDDPPGKKPAVRRPQSFTPEEKLAIVFEAAGLTAGELGLFLRAKGIHLTVLEEWREQALHGLRGSQVYSQLQNESREIRALKREIARKDKALAETAALLVLKKKLQAVWGDEDDDTDPKTDE